MSAPLGRIGAWANRSRRLRAKERHRALSEEIEDARWRYFVPTTDARRRRLRPPPA
jgi:hypothetical protein